MTKRKLSDSEVQDYVKRLTFPEINFDSDDDDYPDLNEKASDETTKPELADSVDDEDNTETFSGEEEGEARQEEGQRMTAFNMTEELEEGHFDSAGHFIWNKEKEIRDNWIDNINWQKIKEMPTVNPIILEDSSDDEVEGMMEKYSKLLKYVKPGEKVCDAIRRLAGNTPRLSSMERLKLKKAGKPIQNKDVEAITEIANQILTRAGDMNVYEMTYEYIKDKVKIDEEQVVTVVKEPELDMYADDFGEKEKVKLETAGPSKLETENAETATDEATDEIMWEFKWEQNSDKIEGPFTSRQMHEWATDGYFGDSVYIRRYGKEGGFYLTNRVDFDIFL